MNLPFENDEYSYYATALIFGVHSPKVRDFTIYSFEGMRQHRDLSLAQRTHLNPNGRLETPRSLTFDFHRQLTTGQTQMSSSLNKALTYVDKEHRINISDSIFYDEELQYFSGDWNEVTKNKVEKLSILIHSLHVRTIDEIPLLINEFPEICRVILAFPQYVLPPVKS